MLKKFPMENNRSTTDKKKILEQLHQKMIEEIQDYAIILMDLDGTILSWNKKLPEQLIELAIKE
jgi:predicted HAD superfamily phosphohydrolase YqeG